MGIEYFEGLITPDQVCVPDHMRVEAVESLEVNGSCIVDDSCIWMDRDGMMWLDGKAPRLTEEEIGDDLDLGIWVIRLDIGFIVDITRVRDQFVDPADDMVKFTPSEYPSYTAEGDSYTKVPIIGLVTCAMESDFVRDILSTKYGITYPGKQMDSPES